jgi:hypothetical protein
MRIYLQYIIGCLTLIVPMEVFASVTIHEVAWMGSVASANHEWIELYNSGQAAVVVSGWTITDGMNLSISLDGELAAGEYAVLERTSEESAPGTAFMLYTGALVNTGATLMLRNQDQEIMDQVAGGTDWELLGGDNVTKETAQYTTGGWVTAPGTPGAPNTINQSDTGSEDGELGESSGRSGVLATTTQAAKTVLLRNTKSQLSLAVVGQTVAYVQQTVPFSVVPDGLGETITRSLLYTWNFGDSFSNTGKEVKHRFAYPGTYVVTVHGAYAKHTQVARHEITILPITMSLTRNARYDLQIHNDAPYEIDISGYRINGDREIVLPSHTILLPKGTLTIAAKRLEEIPGRSSVTLYDATGTVIAATNVTSVSYEVSGEDTLSHTAVSNHSVPIKTNIPDIQAAVVTAPMLPELVDSKLEFLAETPENIVTTTADTAKDSRLPYSLLVVLISLGVIVVLLTPRKLPFEALPK